MAKTQHSSECYVPLLLQSYSVLFRHYDLSGRADEVRSKPCMTRHQVQQAF